MQLIKEAEVGLRVQDADPGCIVSLRFAFRRKNTVALSQNISPVNSEVMDALVHSDKLEWIPQRIDPTRHFMKVLWIGPESGRAAVLIRSLKGSIVPRHKHLGDAHVLMLKGRLKVRDAELVAGDYLYEANGMIHPATEALEDTEYLMIMSGAVLFFDENNFLGFQGWEEFHRAHQEHVAQSTESTSGRRAASVPS